MSLLGVIVFLLLLAIAALHLAWGLGVRFPARGERELVALVIGATGTTKMPSAVQCAAAAAAIFAAGLVALALAGFIRIPVPTGIIGAAGLIAVFVFAGRGIAGYVPAWRRRFSQEPFATLDQRVYSPLCFVLASAFAALFFFRPGM
jgi:hypothetical protein